MTHSDMTTPADETARIESGAPRATARSSDDVRYSPGTMVAGRYRIASLLGAGGMGEVYRADDIRLGQPVALKFLPARLSRDPVLLGRLHDEVRLGRQIAHPNVCRTYDIVDWEDVAFIAMEFVDGEDLSRLLRRIGRLPHDKAVEIAHGVAAGLAAAHAKGILHRDLKPANVMLDSHGEARIMDFGLALDASNDDGTISGTPAYLAPEVIQGAPATIQSDLYALGLMMYELFTGARVHQSRTFPERLREIGSDITTPSNLIRDLDPTVERVILRCLSNDPAQRPRSAREVIEALPGGDPLAAALAAGETPSPRLVAAAGTEGSLSRAAAWSLFGTVALLLAAIVALAVASRRTERFQLDEPPEVRLARSRELLRSLGVPEQPFRHHGFAPKVDYEAWLLADPSSGGWGRIRRGLPIVSYWMRSEPRPLLDTEFGHTPKPGPDSPPQTAPGSAAIEIDSRNRLYSLTVIPEAGWPRRAAGWDRLLGAAGLARARLRPAEPRLVPPAFADERAAWSGTHPNDGTSIRVEAAAFRGTPVWFRIVAPWNEADMRGRVPFGGPGFMIFLATLMTLAGATGIVLAWRNLRARRGDRPGAVRVGALILVSGLIGHLAVARHAPVLFHELKVVVHALQSALFEAGAFCLVYLALEPMIRRRWPQGLISWTRAISGDLRNPMVGRDLLVGLAGGLVHTLIAYGTSVIRSLSRGDQLPPWEGDLRILDGSLDGVGHLASAAESSIIMALTFLIAFMVLTAVLRRRALAIGALFLILFGGYLFASTEPAMMAAFALLCALLTFVLTRFGLLAMAAMQFGFLATMFFPLPDGFSWHTARSSVSLLLLAALAVWAFRRSLGGRSAFGEGE